MGNFVLFATPWWVNIFILTPFVAYIALRKSRASLAPGKIFVILILGAAFGLVEAATIVYLRTALGMPGEATIPLLQALGSWQKTLLAVEILRESATIVILASVAALAAKAAGDRWAAFLLAFASWDIFYYLALRLIINWPVSFISTDVLFLIPVPWQSQVWFPLLISGLLIAAVFAARFHKHR